MYHNIQKEGRIQISNLVEVLSIYNTVSHKYSKAQGQSSRSQVQPIAFCLLVPLGVKKKMTQKVKIRSAGFPRQK